MQPLCSGAATPRAEEQTQPESVDEFWNEVGGRRIAGGFPCRGKAKLTGACDAPELRVDRRP